MKKILLPWLLFFGIITNALAVVVPATPVVDPGIPATVTEKMAANDAIKEFNALAHADKKARIKEARKLWKANKAALKTNAVADSGETNTILLAILAILLPPLAVYLHEHEINSKFWLSILLTLLFWIPGVIYALIVVL